MSETIEKNQYFSDTSTWDLAIKYIRNEISQCLEFVPLEQPDPDKIEILSNRLKMLVCTLDRLQAAYDELFDIRTLVSKNQQEQP